MKIFYALILIVASSSVLAENEYCANLADITMTQAVGKSYVVESFKGSDVEPWRMLWFLSGEKYDALGVKKKRQRKISRDIIKVKSISGNPKIDAFLISGFYYAQCVIPKKKRRFKSLLKIDNGQFVNCWNIKNNSQEFKLRLRECIVAVSTKP